MHGFLVVDETSADPGIAGVVPIPMDDDHVSICTPPNKDAHVYKRVKRFIRDCLQPPELQASSRTDQAPVSDASQDLGAKPLDRRRDPRPPSAPTVGIITALPHESAAVRAILGNPPRVNVPGSGSGRIYWKAEVPSPHGGIHRIVIAQAGMGNNVAAIRASLLLSHFPTVTSLIMCGIAGGIPNPARAEDHVRLGDIVISNIKGIVQYDFVKRTDDVEEVRSAPHRPSAELLEAVEALVADEHLGQRPWERWLAEGLSRLKWGRPEVATDVLIGPSGMVIHPDDPGRRDDQPRVFLGPIASANTLLKDPTKRDALRDRFGAKAVEMEGSGISDASWSHGIGYLVVRGICDYCDANKNDLWQKYAALSAAAYVRALLESMPGKDDQVPHPVEDRKSQATMMSKIEDEIRTVLRPLMDDKDGRKARLDRAFAAYPALLDRIDVHNETAVFLPLLLKKLREFGAVERGRPAVCVLLVIRQPLIDG